MCLLGHPQPQDIWVTCNDTCALGPGMSAGNEDASACEFPCSTQDAMHMHIA